MKWDMLDPQRKVCKLSDVDVFVSILRILIFHIHAAPEQKPNTGFQKYSRFQSLILLSSWCDGSQDESQTKKLMHSWNIEKSEDKNGNTFVLSHQ